MNRKLIALALPFVLAAPASVVAQEEDEGPSSYSYATYHYCNTGGQDRVDDIYANHYVPVMDKMVADGKVAQYGWLAHHTGGKWRRVEYYTAPTLDALLDAGTARNEAFEAADPDGKIFAEFSKTCSNHDDYIWASNGVGSGAENRGAAGFSVYFVCDETRESRADEIVENNFAPIYDKHVTDGKITSWGWLEHWVGGKYRRLLTMTGADHKSLLNARNDLIEALFSGEGMEELGNEFTSICGSHSDYMWNIVHETP